MATTIRFYYDATIAVALTSVFALVVALIAAVIVGGNAPSFSVAIIAFCAYWCNRAFSLATRLAKISGTSSRLISPLMGPAG